MKNKDNELKQVGEPETEYQLSNKMVFFSSFEEAAEDNYKWLASLTPEQHLANTVQLISRLYSDALKKQPEIGTDFKILP